MREYIAFFNYGAPASGIDQQIPIPLQVEQ
jgi:hypothetical protein